MSGVNTKSRQAITEKFITDLGGYLQSVDYPKKYAENTAAVLIGSLITLEDPSQVSTLLTVLVYVLTHEITEDK